jgi:predicted  nucleic acid-binding Zn ribbon protein
MKGGAVMKLTEKMSYLQGLIDGLEIDKSTKEGKALFQMSDVLAELVVYVEDLQSQVDELTELCDILDKDLGAVEEDFYDDKNFTCGNCDECPEEDKFDGEDFSDDDDDSEDYELEDDDEELYEVTCPSCGDNILIDESMVDEGSINCPNCGELLEFDFDNLTIEDFEEEQEDIADDKTEK